MKIQTSTLLWIIGFSLVSYSLALTSTETKVVQHTDAADPQKEGFWSHRVQWKSRWVKYWREKTIYEPVWKKVWSPSVQNEWVPLPNAPPGYIKADEQYNVLEVS